MEWHSTQFFESRLAHLLNASKTSRFSAGPDSPRQNGSLMSNQGPLETRSGSSRKCSTHERPLIDKALRRRSERFTQGMRDTLMSLFRGD